MQNPDVTYFFYHALLVLELGSIEGVPANKYFSLLKKGPQFKHIKLQTINFYKNYKNYKSFITTVKK